jgi:hypothetical protein
VSERAPSPAARALVDELKLDFVTEAAGHAAVYARRAASAARRRDRLGLHVRLRQARLCLKAAVEMLDGEAGK